ncbi:MAG: PilZ domain-containing protein [Gammaproteobacteria bacterium]|nr:PilZ domain-containing protein [Gammaproteobacteria bacterium]
MAKFNERRNSPRLMRDDRLFIQILGASENPELVGTTLSCSAVDISRQGIRLGVAHEAPVGSEIELWIDIKGISDKYFLNGFIKWCYELDSDSAAYELGIELTDKAMTDLAIWQQMVDEMEESDPR